MRRPSRTAAQRGVSRSNPHWVVPTQGRKLLKQQGSVWGLCGSPSWTRVSNPCSIKPTRLEPTQILAQQQHASESEMLIHIGYPKSISNPMTERHFANFWSASPSMVAMTGATDLQGLGLMISEPRLGAPTMIPPGVREQAVEGRDSCRAIKVRRGCRRDSR